ncbi:MAG: DEAD/DEAH box helicase [Nanoarchaeota archaeon]
MTYTGTLRHYQQEAVIFTTNRKSTLLGHDLGLGKSHISMAYCEQIKHQNPNVLILCPSAIIYQWQEEITKFTDSKCIVINGSKKQRQKQWQEDAYYYITNYEKLRTDIELFQKTWGVVILDECTKIKSPKAILTQKSYQLRAVKKLCLSGTPIHNTPNDLYSIVNFLYPNLLGSWWQFANRYIEFEQREMNGYRFNEVVGYRNLDELHRKISMFFIRKRKEDVLKELPPVIYETLTCEMNPNQADVYEQIFEEMIALHDEENILHLLTALKLLSNHPTLLKETKGEKIKKFSPLISDESSGKLKVLLEFIEENKDKKIVVFSEYVKMLHIIAQNLTIPYRMFNGQQSKEDNNKALHEFREKEEVRILLSSESGGYGVNLQNASIVVNYDLPYNPSDFMQRVGRLHRIGQLNPVVCINLITFSSIENKVLKILLSKQMMIDQIVEGSVNEVSFIKEIWRELKNERNNGIII